MKVIKRDGREENVSFDKITARLMRLVAGLDTNFVDPVLIAQKVTAGVYDKVKTTDLDNLAAETAAYMTMTHPDYAMLASRIAVSNLHKNTQKSFSEVISRLRDCVDCHGNPSPLVSAETAEIVKANARELDSAIVYARDNNYDYFGFKTMERSYLLRINGEIVERPQHMLMRVAVGIHGANIAAALRTYDMMSQGWFTHASPTLFNAGTPRPQLSSCFLITMKEDSIEGIYDTLKTCAMISKSAGGIGLSVHNIRAKGSYIRGTNGVSNGLVPLLRVFNNTARYVDQGGGKRKGAFAIYIEPWHADIFDVIDLRRNTGAEENRARDLFYGMWVPDLFMRRVEADGHWTLFCPDEAPGLCDVCGPAFDKLYAQYEDEGRGRRVIRAQELWQAILTSQMETGLPYMMYKDACNLKSNQQHLGTIRSSNLCTEIVEYTAPDEVAVCNLASIALPKFVADGEFDHKMLFEVVKHVTGNLDRIIDINYYPVPEAKKSNIAHRPLGIGVQGLADAFLLLRLPFDSDGARVLNREIFETIYFAALAKSCELAHVYGPYPTYQGSPVSKGILQFDMWGVKPSARWDWATLRANIAKHGVRNSLLVAPMPTASTSQILGNNECFEPYTTNIYTRRVLSGDFIVVNHHLLRDLSARGLWTKNIRDRIIAANGSVQAIDEIPAEMRMLYRTVWEIKQRALIEMAADRGAFIDQSQSFNVFMAEPTLNKLSSMHFYGWKLGLKTGVYYMRSKPAADPIKFTLDMAASAAAPPVVPQPKTEEAPNESSSPSNLKPTCSLDKNCDSCGA